MGKVTPSSFDSSAKHWDTPAKAARSNRIARQMRDLIDQFAPDATSGVEYGCGTGQVGFAMEDRFETLTFVDSSTAMIAEVEKKVERKEDPDAVQRGSVMSGPAVSGSTVSGSGVLGPPVFKTVVGVAQGGSLPGVFGEVFFLSLSLHHVSDVPALLRSFHSMMPAGGLLIIYDLDHEGGQFHAGGRHDGHAHHGFRREDLGAQLEAAGFSVLEVQDGPPLIRKNGEEFRTFMMAARALSRHPS